MTSSDDTTGAPAVSIVAYPNGPLLVRGDVALVTVNGEPIERHRRTVALCRCGVSTIKPYCDGTHKLVNFRTDEPAPDSTTNGEPGQP